MKDNTTTPWENTDDMQRCRKISDGVYELIEANECDDNFLISSPMEIDLADWKEGDSYDDEAISIIKSYYGSLENFQEQVPDISTQEQLLAEMIYESTSSLDSSFGFLTEAEATTLLDNYCERGVLEL